MQRNPPRRTLKRSGNSFLLFKRATSHNSAWRERFNSGTSFYYSLNTHKHTHTPCTPLQHVGMAQTNRTEHLADHLHGGRDGGTVGLRSAGSSAISCTAARQRRAGQLFHHEATPVFPVSLGEPATGRYWAWWVKLQTTRPRIHLNWK